VLVSPKQVQEQVTEGKQFFFAKKNQKTFAHKVLALPQPTRPICKSICFFFQKEALACLNFLGRDPCDVLLGAAWDEHAAGQASH
jgi:hypothetical protein